MRGARGTPTPREEKRFMGSGTELRGVWGCLGLSQACGGSLGKAGHPQRGCRGPVWPNAGSVARTSSALREPSLRIRSLCPAKEGAGGFCPAPRSPRQPQPCSLLLDLDAGILRAGLLWERGRPLGGLAEMHHVQVGIGEVVLVGGRRAGLDAGVFRLLAHIDDLPLVLLRLVEVQVGVGQVVGVGVLCGEETQSVGSRLHGGVWIWLLADPGQLLSIPGSQPSYLLYGHNSGPYVTLDQSALTLLDGQCSSMVWRWVSRLHTLAIAYSSLLLNAIGLRVLDTASQASSQFLAALPSFSHQSQDTACCLRAPPGNWGCAGAVHCRALPPRCLPVSSAPREGAKSCN